MKGYKKRFIGLSQSTNALRFGQFELKSGRISPYFFNAGLFYTGEALEGIASCYVDKILEKDLEFDILFGPAYKGIPLVSAISVILFQRTGKSIPWAFNRKEVKKHGEGGSIVGSPIKGKVLIIDDVITAGTAIRYSIDIIRQEGGEVSNILVALDRQEVSNNIDKSAIEIINYEYSIKTHAIVQLADLLDYIKCNPLYEKSFKELNDYRKEYGVSYGAA